MSRGSVWFQSERLVLLTVQPRDLADIERWLDREVLAGMLAGRCHQAEALLVKRAGLSEPVGLVISAAGDPEPGWLTTRLIVIDPSQRSQGLGGDAVLALEAGARQRGVAERFRGPAPFDNGLAVYFWLRLGYRPTYVGVDQCGQSVLWMVRGEP